MEATRILREEHDVIIRGLDVLTVMATSAHRGELPRHQDAADIIVFIREFADSVHHGKEEGMLFPAMAQVGLPQSGGPIAVMLAEHEEARELMNQATAAIAAPGLPANAARAFASAVGAYVRLIRHHIVKENEMLFKIAEERITGQAMSELDESFARVLSSQKHVRRAQLAKLEALESRYVKAVA